MNIKCLSALVVLLLSGCATMPHGPSVPVMPAPGKPFDLFVREDRDCQQFADYQAGGSMHKTADDTVIQGAVGGTIIGAAIGTGIGAIAGDPGAGAIIGAAAGLAQGTAMGADAAYHTTRGQQHRFNIAYQQCMYSKGNQIAGTSVAYAPAAYPPPPSPPPPPSGAPRQALPPRY